MPAITRSFATITGGLLGLAWVVLYLWGQSPYGRYLDHGGWSDINLATSFCRVVPAGNVVVPILLYTGGWLLMSGAMMLPTTLPLLQRFRLLVAGRSNRLTLLGLLICGYLVVWMAFGIAAHVLDQLVHLAARHGSWLMAHGWVVGVVVLGVAGAFQFSRLKYHCLDRCRTPFGFIVQHWHGKTARRDAFQLGLHHGLFCVGCCWALMLLMFVVGTGNLGWMLILAAIMATEKNVPWGRRISRPLGVALLAWAALIAAGNLVA
jgi:predicted metal-binding membrane protein